MRLVAVIPVLIGPLQVLIALLPAISVAFSSALLALFKPSTFKAIVKIIWRLKYQIALFIITIFVIVRAIGFVFDKFNKLTTTITVCKVETEDNWLLARGSLSRLGSLPDTEEPVTGGIIWQHKRRNEAFFASAAIVGKNVFVSAADMSPFSQKGRIYSFDADTGNIIWIGEPDEYAPTFSSPVVSGNYVVCGEGLHWTKNARVVCLDRITGKTIWTFRTASHVECTPFIYNNRVYVGAGDDGYYCLDLKTGKKIWHVNGDRYPDAETSLVVFDGKVYAGLGNGGMSLCILDAETGEELNRLQMPYPLFAPPAIYDGKLYIGMGNGDYINSGKGGEVRCIDIKTLKTEWSFPLDMTVLGSPVVDNDDIIFASRDGGVYKVNRKGRLISKFDCRVSISTAPAVTKNYIYVVNDSGSLLVLRRSNMDVVWEFRLGTKPLFISSPVVAYGHVYVGTQNDGFLCIGEPSKYTSIEPVYNDFSPIPDNGVFIWNYNRDTNCSISGRCVGIGKELYISFKDEVVKLNIEDFEPRPESVEWFPEIKRLPLEIKTDGEYIIALDRLENMELWRIKADTITPAELVKDCFYIGRPGRVECRSVLDGSVIWSNNVEILPGIPPLVSRDRMLVATSNSLMICELSEDKKEFRLWMDLNWLGIPCGEMSLLNSHIFIPVSGWGIVNIGGGK